VPYGGTSCRSRELTSETFQASLKRTKHSVRQHPAGKKERKRKSKATETQKKYSGKNDPTKIESVLDHPTRSLKKKSTHVILRKAKNRRVFIPPQKRKLTNISGSYVTRLSEFGLQRKKKKTDKIKHFPA
jgi:hypothetical protein